MKAIIKDNQVIYQDVKEEIVLTVEDKIIQKKQLLNKYKEDVEQVELFGMERNDYYEKKDKCRQLVLELRQLEKSN